MAGSRKDNKGRVLKRGECQRKDLSYMYSYTDPFGKRKCIYAQDLKTLREKEETLLKDQLDGLDMYLAGNANLNYVFDRYIGTKLNLRPNTRSGYIYTYDHFVREEFGQRKISSIRFSDVCYYYTHLINSQGVKPNTVDSIHTLLHPTFQLAVRDGIIRTNPATGAMTEIKKLWGNRTGVRHALTLDQQRAFLNAVAGSPVFAHWKPLFVVLFGTGCRIGEVIGLRWEDIDFDKRIININHSITYYPTEGSRTSILALSLPKTKAGIREIPMLPQVYDAFKEEYDVQTEEGFNTSVIDGMTGFIFKNRNGNVHNPQTVNRTIKRILDWYNGEEVVKAKKEKRQPLLIPHFSCHHIRHTFCTRFCENETNLKVIQSIMGHADIETTMDIYAEATHDKKVESFENLAVNLNLF